MRSGRWFRISPEQLHCSFLSLTLCGSPSKALKKRILPHGALEAAPNRDADFSIV